MLNFGHNPLVLAFWRKLAARAIRLAPTPFYLFSATPLGAALAELETICAGAGLPVRHWLSCKTQPFAPLLSWWRKQGRPIEVVSEYEFLAARQAGFRAAQILINGPAKHHWLPRQAIPGLSVNFDSLAEIIALLPWAKNLRWRTGIRLCTSQEYDPENPSQPTQFGFTLKEAANAIRLLCKAGLPPQIAHFHLRTNVEKPACYQAAVADVAAICQASNWFPAYLDCGGGWPPRHTLSRTGRPYAADFHLPAMRLVFRRVRALFPGLREIWLENGRFFSARSGVLVIKVLEVKDRPDLRQLLCDGGRVMNALVSNWEQHQLLTLPQRRAPLTLTAVYGSTCMAFDQLTTRALPKSVRAGDCLLWLEAGAYHLPWETRFSHGHAAIVWHENDRLQIARQKETFSEWWGRLGAADF